MAKENSIVVKTSEFITKYCLFAAVFLVPIFFLPWTSDVLDFNKQTVLAFLVFVALFGWMLKILVAGKLQLNISKIHIVAGILFLIYFFSTIFSVYRYGSFWGWPQSTADSLLSYIVILLGYFLITNVFSKKNIFSLIATLSVSALIAELVGIFQLLGLYIPFDFAKSVAFNTIGSAGGLGFFCAITLPLATSMLVLSKKWWKVLFVAQIILSAVIFFLVNFTMVWWAVAAGCALVVIFGVIKRDFFDGRWMALPMFFLTVALFFIILSPQIPWPAQKANEIYLSQGASFNVALQTVKENPVFGSGPGTFYYGFSKFKDPSFSKTSLWNVGFNQGASKVLTDLATIGILGFAVLLAIIILPLFFGIKYLIFEKDQTKFSWVLTLGFTSALAVEGLAYFFYNGNIVLNFIFFFAIACLILLVSSEKKEFELKSSSVATLVVTFTFTLLFIFGAGLLILDGQRYAAEINYFKALAFFQAGNDTQGLKSLEKAASLNSASDLYFRQLSQAYLMELQKEIQNTKGSATDEQKTRVQTFVANAVNAGKIATDINSKSAINWSNRGYIYQSLFGLISDSGTWAENSYNEAIKLDPNDPYLFAQQGNISFISAQNATADQKNKLLVSAKNNLEKSTSLNPTYSNGLYSLGLVYDALGQKDKAIEVFTKVQQLNPQDTVIPKILNNLKDGLPALQSPAPLVENLTLPTPSPSPEP